MDLTCFCLLFRTLRLSSGAVPVFGEPAAITSMNATQVTTTSGKDNADNQKSSCRSGCMFVWEGKGRDDECFAGGHAMAGRH